MKKQVTKLILVSGILLVGSVSASGGQQEQGIPEQGTLDKVTPFFIDGSEIEGGWLVIGNHNRITIEAGAHVHNRGAILVPDEDDASGKFTEEYTNGLYQGGYTGTLASTTGELAYVINYDYEFEREGNVDEVSGVEVGPFTNTHTYILADNGRGYINPAIKSNSEANFVEFSTANPELISAIRKMEDDYLSDEGRDTPYDKTYAFVLATELGNVSEILMVNPNPSTYRMYATLAGATSAEGGAWKYAYLVAQEGKYEFMRDQILWNGDLIIRNGSEVTMINTEGTSRGGVQVEENGKLRITSSSKTEVGKNGHDVPYTETTTSGSFDSVVSIRCSINVAGLKAEAPEQGFLSVEDGAVVKIPSGVYVRFEDIEEYWPYDVWEIRRAKGLEEIMIWHLASEIIPDLDSIGYTYGTFTKKLGGHEAWTGTGSPGYESGQYPEGHGTYGNQGVDTSWITGASMDSTKWMWFNDGIFNYIRNREMLFERTHQAPLFRYAPAKPSAWSAGGTDKVYCYNRSDPEGSELQLVIGTSTTKSVRLVEVIGGSSSNIDGMTITGNLSNLAWDFFWHPYPGAQESGNNILDALAINHFQGPAGGPFYFHANMTDTKFWLKSSFDNDQWYYSNGDIKLTASDLTLHESI